MQTMWEHGVGLDKHAGELARKFFLFNGYATRFERRILTAT